MFFRIHERWIAELNVALQYEVSTTSSGEFMTLPAAAADLKDWLEDRRKFVSKQYDDWAQVIRDFQDSTIQTGPKLAAHVAPITTQIESLLPALFARTLPNQVASPIESLMQKLLPVRIRNRLVPFFGSVLRRLTPQDTATEKPVYEIADAVRTKILGFVDQLASALDSDDAIIAAWRDLVASARNLNRTVDDVAFRRDTLYFIADRRNLDVVGSFGVFGRLRDMLTDVASSVHEETAAEAGVEYLYVPSQPGTPSGLPLKHRLRLCERFSDGGLTEAIASCGFVPPQRHCRNWKLRTGR
jgi:hypothetical protein